MAFMPQSEIDKLKVFILASKSSPNILWQPELKFFRDFIEECGGKVPEAKNPNEKNVEEEADIEENIEAKPATTEDKEMSEESEPESIESEVEIDKDGVIEPETTEPPEFGDSTKIVSEDDEILASEKRSEAMSAVSDGDLDKAVQLLTEAIKANPIAMLYAKRAGILLKQKHVKAVIRDCDEALKLNPDSASARKFRGKANGLLGNWIESAKDLRIACRLDFDEQADEWLKEVQPKAHKLEEHIRKYERKHEEKELRERQKRIQKAQEEHKKAREREEKEKKKFNGMPGDMPFEDMGGAGGMPGGLGDFFKDPEILAAMQDPEVAAAFQDVSSNPSNILKYQNNPKVSAVINKLMKKFGGGAGMPGGAGSFPGGMPGAGGFPSGMPGAGGFPGGMPEGFPPKGPSPSDDLD